MLKKSRILFLALAMATAGVSLAVGNAPLPEPSGRVILMVSGAIDRANAGGEAHFDRKMLESLGLARVETSTSWTEGTPEFEGVLVRDVIRAVGARGTKVTAIALNDYSIDIPLSDFESYDVLFALRMNGVDLTVRDKGPIWIVYPRDSHRELQNQKVDAKWIWQLAQIVIR